MKNYLRNIYSRCYFVRTYGCSDNTGIFCSKCDKSIYSTVTKYISEQLKQKENGNKLYR